MIATGLAGGKSPWRLLLATVLAPANGPLIYCVGMLLGSGYPYSGPGHMEKHFDIVFFLTVLSYPICIGLGALIVGFLYLSKRLTGLNCIGLALAVGAAAGFIFTGFIDRLGAEVPVSATLLFAAISAVVAGLTALTFCLVGGLKMKPPAGQRPLVSL